MDNKISIQRNVSHFLVSAILIKILATSDIISEIFPNTIFTAIYKSEENISKFWPSPCKESVGKSYTRYESRDGKLFV